MEVTRETGLEPCFVPPDRLTSLTLHPPVAAHLIRLLDPGVSRSIPYVGTVQVAKPGPHPQPEGRA